MLRINLIYIIALQIYAHRVIDQISNPQTVNNDLIQTCSFAFQTTTQAVETLCILIEGNGFIMARCENLNLMLIPVFCES